MSVPGALSLVGGGGDSPEEVIGELGVEEPLWREGR